MRLDSKQARRVGKHRARIRLRKALSAQHLVEHLGVAPRQVGMRLAFARRVTEVTPAVDHLLARAPADAELQAAARDQIRRARILPHVERVFIAHVDDRRADFNAAGFRTYGSEKWKRRRELPREMMHAEKRAIRAKLLGSDRKFDGLQ